MKILFLSVFCVSSINLSFGQANKFEHCASWINDQLKHDRSLPDSTVNAIEFKNDGTVDYDPTKLPNVVHASNYSEFHVPSSIRFEIKKFRVEKNNVGQISKILYELPVLEGRNKYTGISYKKKMVYEYNFSYDDKGCHPENSKYLEANNDGPLIPSVKLDYQKCLRFMVQYKKLPEESDPSKHFSALTVKLPPPEHLKNLLIEALNNFYDPELLPSQDTERTNIDKILAGNTDAKLWRMPLAEAFLKCGGDGSSPNSLAWFINQRDVINTSTETPDNGSTPQ